MVEERKDPENRERETPEFIVYVAYCPQPYECPVKTTMLVSTPVQGLHINASNAGSLQLQPCLY